MSGERDRKDKKRKEEEEEYYPDFGEEFHRHRVKVRVFDREIEGVVLEGRKYFFKLVNAEGKVFYINKAMVCYVEFLE